MGTEEELTDGKKTKFAETEWCQFPHPVISLAVATMSLLDFETEMPDKYLGIAKDHWSRTDCQKYPHFFKKDPIGVGSDDVGSDDVEHSDMVGACSWLADAEGTSFE